MRSWKLRYLCRAIPVCLPAAAPAGRAWAFLGDTWLTATPQSQGIDSSVLLDALDYFHTNAGGVGTDERVIVRNGRLIWAGPGADNVHEIYSRTKTFTSTVLGLLAAEGILFSNPAGTPGKEQGGVRSSPRDLARYGLLHLNRGNWNGRQVLDASFVDRAVSTQVPTELDTAYSDLTGRYGFFWWTKGLKPDGARPRLSAPPQTFAAHGAGLLTIVLVYAAGDLPQP